MRKVMLTKSTTKRLRQEMHSKLKLGSCVGELQNLTLSMKMQGLATLSTFMKNWEAPMLQRLMHILNITPLNGPLISNSLQE